jgi:hypothetical protein
MPVACSMQVAGMGVHAWRSALPEVWANAEGCGRMRKDANPAPTSMLLQFCSRLLPTIPACGMSTLARLYTRLSSEKPSNALAEWRYVV